MCFCVDFYSLCCDNPQPGIIHTFSLCNDMCSWNNSSKMYFVLFKRDCLKQNEWTADITFCIYSYGLFCFCLFFGCLKNNVVKTSLVAKESWWGYPTRQQGKRILQSFCQHHPCFQRPHLEEQQEIFQEILWWLTARMAVGSGPVVTQPAQEPSYSLRLTENCIVSASGECDWSLNKNIIINFALSY